MPAWFAFENEIARHVAYTVVALLVITLLARVAQRVVHRYVEEPVRRYRAYQIIRRIGSLIGAVAIVFIWSPGEQNIVTVLTVIGAGLAISMREALLSIVGWMNLIVRAPYRQGDRVEVNGVKGDVLDIRLFHSTMMEIGGWVDGDQSTGRVVHVPNNWVYVHPIYNYTRGFGFIWNEIGVTVTFRSDWAAAREIMLALAQESTAIVEQQAAREIRSLSREYLVHYSILSPFVYVAVRENGVRLTLRYLCEARKRRGTHHAITLGILDGFKKHGGIEFAFAHTTVYQPEVSQYGDVPVWEGWGRDGEGEGEREKVRKSGSGDGREHRPAD